MEEYIRVHATWTSTANSFNRDISWSKPNLSLMTFNSESYSLEGMVIPFNWDASRCHSGAFVCVYACVCVTTAGWIWLFTYLAAAFSLCLAVKLQGSPWKRVWKSFTAAWIWQKTWCVLSVPAMLIGLLACPSTFSTQWGLYSCPPSQHPHLTFQNQSNTHKLAAHLPKEWHEYRNGIWYQMEI